MRKTASNLPTRSIAAALLILGSLNLVLVSLDSVSALLAASVCRGNRTVNLGSRHRHFHCGNEDAIRFLHEEDDDLELDSPNGSSTSSSCISRRTCASSPSSLSSSSRVHCDPSSSDSTYGGRYPWGARLDESACLGREERRDCASVSWSGLVSMGEEGGGQSGREDPG